MKDNHTLLSVASWGLLFLEIALFALTVWLLPTRLRTKWYGYFVFLAIIIPLWLGLAVISMLFDGIAGNDIPGIGYLLLGFLAGGIGSIVYLRRLLL